MGCGSSNTKVGLATAPGPLPPKLGKQPDGSFRTELGKGAEGHRDFARIFMANDRKVFLMAKGLPSPVPLQVSAAPATVNVGDMSHEVIARAVELLGDRLREALSAATVTMPPCHGLESLRDALISAMTVNV